MTAARLRRTLLPFLWTAFTLAPDVGAQQPDTVPGIALSLLYGMPRPPTLSLAPFTGAAGTETVATQAEAIVARDLDYSDRFQLTGPPPASLLALDDLDYRLWDQAGIDYLVRGRVERDGESLALYLEVHDVLRARLVGVRRSALPPPTDRGFRMAVHTASDAVVEQVFDEPGIAATLIAFSMRAQGSATKDLWVVESDGENLRRVSRHELSILSPSWHPSGERIAFMSLPLDGEAAIYEVELATGRERKLPKLGEGQVNTPAYLPGGERLAVTLDRGDGSRIVAYDVAKGCCTSGLTSSNRSQDLSPSFSPDGNWMAFTSNRLGPPLVFVQPTGGGAAQLVAPYMVGQPADFSAPKWSPRGGMIAYHGSIGRGQRYQIVVTEFGDAPGRTLRLTSEGNNENPSWAPDGHHLVFVGERQDGSGLFVTDATTGRTRRLVASGQTFTPAWSPTISPK